MRVVVNPTAFVSCVTSFTRKLYAKISKIYSIVIRVDFTCLNRVARGYGGADLGGAYTKCEADGRRRVIILLGSGVVAVVSSSSSCGCVAGPCHGPCDLGVCDVSTCHLSSLGMIVFGSKLILVLV